MYHFSFVWLQLVFSIFCTVWGWEWPIPPLRSDGRRTIPFPEILLECVSSTCTDILHWSVPGTIFISEMLIWVPKQLLDYEALRSVPTIRSACLKNHINLWLLWQCSLPPCSPHIPTGMCKPHRTDPADILALRTARSCINFPAFYIPIFHCEILNCDIKELMRTEMFDLILLELITFWILILLHWSCKFILR